MRRSAWFVGVSVCAGLLTGCVERKFVITSDPPGAVVYQNGRPLGATPVDGHFVYYGDYDFTLIREGYATLKARERIAAPWYQYPLVDFVSENLVPWTIHDIRRLHFQLQPPQTIRPDELLNQAQGLRDRGQVLGPGSGPP
jgi:hypothetical protein